MNRRKTEPLRAARRHAFTPAPGDPDQCTHCPAPELNRTLHPPIRFFRDGHDRDAVMADAQAQLASTDAPYHQAVIEEAWLWLTQTPHASASDLEVLQFFEHDRRASQAAITTARRCLEAVGLLERAPGFSFAYDTPSVPRTGRRHPHYARPLPS